MEDNVGRDGYVLDSAEKIDLIRHLEGNRQKHFSQEYVKDGSHSAAAGFRELALVIFLQKIPRKAFQSIMVGENTSRFGAVSANDFANDSKINSVVGELWQ